MSCTRNLDYLPPDTPNIGIEHGETLFARLGVTTVRRPTTRKWRAARSGFLAVNNVHAKLKVAATVYEIICIRDSFSLSTHERCRGTHRGAPRRRRRSEINKTKWKNTLYSSVPISVGAERVPERFRF